MDHIEMSFIGSSNFTATEYLDGSMTLARLWSGVLSDAEVNAEFASAAHHRRGRGHLVGPGLRFAHSEH